MFLNLGPNHLSAHGAFRIVLQLDGEEILDCVPDIGYHHPRSREDGRTAVMAQLYSLHRSHRLSRRVMNNLPLRYGGRETGGHYGPRPST